MPSNIQKQYVRERMFKITDMEFGKERVVAAKEKNDFDAYVQGLMEGLSFVEQSRDQIILDAHNYMLAHPVPEAWYDLILALIDGGLAIAPVVETFRNDALEACVFTPREAAKVRTDSLHDLLQTSRFGTPPNIEHRATPFEAAFIRQEAERRIRMTPPSSAPRGAMGQLRDNAEQRWARFRTQATRLLDISEQSAASSFAHRKITNHRAEDLIQALNAKVSGTLSAPPSTSRVTPTPSPQPSGGGTPEVNGNSQALEQVYAGLDEEDRAFLAGHQPSTFDVTQHPSQGPQLSDKQVSWIRAVFWLSGGHLVHEVWIKGETLPKAKGNSLKKLRVNIAAVLPGCTTQQVVSVTARCVKSFHEKTKAGCDVLQAAVDYVAAKKKA